MSHDDVACVVWRKSIRSGQQGACVEVADIANLVAVRDSKNPDGPQLSLSAKEWRAFHSQVTAGKYDL